MSSTPYIRLESFAAVVFLYMQVTVIVCENAAISGCADSQLVDSSLALKCRYIGKSDVTAIYWKNGSNSDTLALIPGYNAPHCDVFSRKNISFDPHRTSYTCNALSNVYTLTINPLQKLDNNVTWSCTFLDPAPDPVKANCTIHLSETTDVTAGDGRISSPIGTVIALALLCVSIVLNVTMIAYICYTRKRSRCKTCYRRNREQNLEEDCPPYQEPVIVQLDEQLRPPCPPYQEPETAQYDDLLQARCPSYAEISQHDEKLQPQTWKTHTFSDSKPNSAST